MIDSLLELFEDGTELHPVEPSLWSVLEPGGASARYDSIVASYDRMIGSRLYRRLAWGDAPEGGAEFARRAVCSAKGPLLDVGCGSLLFTARAHLDGGRPTLLLDLSLGMLRRARGRLAEQAGDVPPQIALVQADALALPLRFGCAETVLCPGILHLFEEPERLLRSLAAALAPGGRLFLSSLVTDRRFGRGYLRLLERSGEVKSLLDSTTLRALVERETGLRVRCETAGNLAYLHTEPRESSQRGLDSEGPNAAMIEHWNRVAGPGWVAGQASIDAHLAPFLDLAIERADPRPGERVLDVGCGCGATTLALAQRVGAEGRVTGVDLSRPMLARAEERARSAGLSHVEFLNADAQTAALGDGFDLAFSRFGVMFFSDFVAAFRNLRSALSPGGRLCFVCWREFERNGWMGVPMAAAAQHISVSAPAAPGNPGPYGLADGESLRAWLLEAGFEEPELAPLDIGLPVRGGVGLEAAADFMTSMGPVSAALREAGESWREPVRKAVLEGMRPFEKPEGVVLPASCWRVFARNPAAD